MQRAARILFALMATTAAAAPGSAHAQMWLGNFAAQYGKALSYADCASGKLVAPPREIVEARDPAIRLVQNYWKAASASRIDAATTPAWADGEISFKASAIKRLRDPWATDPALEIAAEPSSFARAANEPMNDAIGVWAVHAKGDPADIRGYYVMEFKRFMLRWGLSRVHLRTLDRGKPFVDHYCR